MVPTRILLVVLLQAAAVLCQTRPHIVFFLVDDMGWNDVGFHGLRQIPTPNIDALAYNSIILNNYYVHPACSPSRAALLSGRYAPSTGMQHIVIQNHQAVGMSRNYTLLPEYLNRLGYTSRMVGKWHLGFYRKRYTPMQRGFRSHYGFWSGETDHFFHNSGEIYNVSEMINVPDYQPIRQQRVLGYDFRDDYEPALNRTGEYSTDLFSERAVQVIQQHNPAEPLFLYLPLHGVHRGDMRMPIRAPRKYTNRFTNIDEPRRRNFAGALTAVDLALGDVMEALERQNMLNNTILVFSTDNGSARPGTPTDNGGSNYPLRGGKLSVWEGGVRANGFVWSPLLNRAGVVYNGLMHVTDWLPTLLSAAGGNPSVLPQLDGFNFWNILRENGTSPRTSILHQWDPIYNLSAYRSGDYKIISGTNPGVGEGDHYGDNGREDPPVGVPTNVSQTEQVLRRFLGPNFLENGQPFNVDCGSTTMDPAFSCEPTQGVCLFNINNDPCEYRNLARQQSDVVQRLLSELSRIPVREPLYPPGDFSGNPIYYDGLWTFWRDLPVDTHMDI